MGFLIPIGSIVPKPGTDPGDLELPGPGIYDAEFRVPSWLQDVLGSIGAGGFDNQRKFTVPFANGMNLQHERSQWSGGNITMRARLVQTETNTPGTSQALVAGPTVRTFVKAVTSKWSLVLTTVLIGAIAGALTRVTKFIELPGGLLVAAGGAFLLVATGVAKLRG